MSSSERKPSYLRAAFWNVYNVTLLAGIGVAALATNEPWLLGVGVAAEALWLLFASDSKRLRRAVDAREAEQDRLQAVREMQEMAAQLPTDERRRVQQLGLRAAEIKSEVQRNRAIGGEFMQSQLDRLDALVGEFVHLSVTAHRCESYLARADAKQINRDREAQRKVVESSEDQETRRIARQNMEILEKRLATFDELGRFLARARGQMSLIENTLSLLRDQVVTMTTPDAMTSQLESLVASMEAIRDATRSVDAVVGLDFNLDAGAELGRSLGELEAIREAGPPADAGPASSRRRDRARS